MKAFARFQVLKNHLLEVHTHLRQNKTSIKMYKKQIHYQMLLLLKSVQFQI